MYIDKTLSVRVQFSSHCVSMFESCTSQIHLLDDPYSSMLMTGGYLVTKQEGFSA